MTEADYIDTMQSFGDLHCQCIFSIFPAGAHQLKCKHTCIEKCRPVFLFPMNLHWYVSVDWNSVFDIIM